MTAEIKSPEGYFTIELSLFGEFNLANVLAVIVELAERGFSRTEIEQAVATLETVSGRMQCLQHEGRPMVVVDYCAYTRFLA